MARPRYDPEFGPYFPIQNVVLDDYAETIKASGVAAYAAIARYVNRKTGETCVDQERLARAAGMSVRALRTAIGRLESAGLVKVKPRELKQSNVYALTGVAAGFAGIERQHLPTINKERSLLRNGSGSDSIDSRASIAASSAAQSDTATRIPSSVATPEEVRGSDTEHIGSDSLASLRDVLPQEWEEDDIYALDELDADYDPLALP